MEMIIGRSKAQWELLDTKGTEGPCWHWDPDGAPYLISDMRDGYGIDEVIDPVTGHIHFLGEFQSTLADRRFVSRLHGLYWHVGCAWGRKMISIFWQELVGGGGMGRPLGRALYGDDVLPLGYWEHESPRIGTTETSPLAGVELGRSGLPRQIRRCRLLRGKCTCSMVVAWAHMGFPMVHGAMALSIGIQGYMELCHGAQCHAEECRGTYLCADEQDDAQQVVKVLPPERYPDEGIRHTIGFGTLKF